MTGKVTYTRGEKNEDGSYKWKVTMEAEVDGDKKVKPHEFNDRDDNNDGLPDNADSDGDGVPNSSDAAPTDSKIVERLVRTVFSRCAPPA